MHWRENGRDTAQLCLTSDLVEEGGVRGEVGHGVILWPIPEPKPGLLDISKRKYTVSFTNKLCKTGKSLRRINFFT